MKSCEKKWYPVYTRPRAEKKVAEILAGRGVEVYLPLHRQLRQWSDRKKWMEEPLFKSYLFVKIAPTQFSEILMTKGVSRFIYFSGRITGIQESHITNLRLLLASESDFEVVDRRFALGERVEVVAGVLQGMQGELIESYSEKKFLIRIGETGQGLLVQIPVAFLEPMEHLSQPVPLCMK